MQTKIPRRTPKRVSACRASDAATATRMALRFVLPAIRNLAKAARDSRANVHERRKTKRRKAVGIRAIDSDAPKRISILQANSGKLVQFAYPTLTLPPARWLDSSGRKVLRAAWKFQIKIQKLMRQMTAKIPRKENHRKRKFSKR